MAKVMLKNVTKRFGDQVVVENLSLEIADGEFGCLLGPSGSGKTTTLRMIAGLSAPNSGSIYIGDNLVNHLPPGERDVAMVFQSYALLPHKTVFENLSFPLERQETSKSEIESRVKEIAEILNITELLNKIPAHLSGGEKQRVAIGRAIVRKPKVFLFDEPLTNLDAKLRLHMRAELKKIQKQVGQTAIFTTPDEVEAMAMADKVAVMRKGKLEQYGTTSDIYDHPRNVFVAGFVGSPMINLIDCTFIETGGQAFLDAGEFRLNVTELGSKIKARAKRSEMILGVRPSAINVSDDRQSGECVEAELYTMEPTGAETVLDAKVGETVLKAIVPPTYSPKKNKLWLTFEEKSLHVFDRMTQEAII